MFGGMVQIPINEIRRITKNQNEENPCSRLNSITDIETGEVVCSDCGQVLSEKVEEFGRDGRSFQNNPKDIQRSRVGPGTSLAKHDMGLTTVIGLKNKDASGKSIKIPMRQDIRRMRIWDARAHLHGSRDNNFIQAFNELYVIKDNLALPNAVVEKSAYIYRKAHAKGLIRGRKINTALASSVYAACRQSGTIRTLNDISKVVNIGKKEIAASYRLIVKELELKMPIVDPINCVARIASIMGISEKVNRHAIKTIKKAKEIEFSAGKDPMGLAGAALYISCNIMDEHHSHAEIANAASTSTVTIRNLTSGLLKKLDFLQ